MNRPDLPALAVQNGFARAGLARIAGLKMENAQEVRSLCAKNFCGQYGKTWMCPPGVGDVEACAARILAHEDALVVQHVAQLQDSYDFEGSAEALAVFQDLLRSFAPQVQPFAGEGFLALGAGGCSLCKPCTYPDAPCRFPDKAMASVESYGVNVMLLCQQAGLAYHSGANTVTYTGMYLL